MPGNDSKLRQPLPRSLRVGDFHRRHAAELSMELVGERVGFDREILEPTINRPASLRLVPADRAVAATHLVNSDEPAARMVATALRFRPETDEMQAEVATAAARLRKERISPFLPNVSAGYSTYEFAAGQGVGTSPQRDSQNEAQFVPF